MKEKTLAEKREELFDEWEMPDDFRRDFTEQDKQFIKEVLEEISFLMNNSDYTEDDILNKIKQKAGNL